jgi:molybdenum cofactor cytidylyltransferase
MRFGVVILAAGASSRMGCSKLTLPWGATTILGHLIKTWQQLGARQVGVVCAPGDRAVQRELAFSFADQIPNPDSSRGMFGSIRCAAGWDRWLADLTHFVITLGDQPHIPASTLAAVLTHAAQNSAVVCQPSRNERPRHPVILPRNVFEEIVADGPSTLREFLARHQFSYIEINDEALDLDLDYPTDYASALRRFTSSAPPSATTPLFS